MNTEKKTTYLERLEWLKKQIDYKGEKIEQVTVEMVYQRLLNLLPQIYGPSSTQLEELRQTFSVTAIAGPANYDRRVRSLRAIIGATKLDLENDYISNPQLQIAGEIVGDFLGLAKLQLEEGIKDVAAVLASAAFEDAIKRKCIDLNIDTEDRDLTQLANALKAAGVLKGPQVPIVTGFVRLRNNAMHADWTKIQAPEVSSLIAFTEQFLLSNFV